MSDIGFNKVLEDYVSETEENLNDNSNVDPINTDEYFLIGREKSSFDYALFEGMRADRIS